MSIRIYYLSEVRTHSIYLSGTVFLFAYRILERDLKRELASSGLENNWELYYISGQMFMHIKSRI